MADEPEFYKLLAQRYTEFEDKLDVRSPDESRQLWHTPTELFRPYYGEAIARYLVESHNLTKNPSHDLIVYEMGAGNGTLMLNILDHIRDFYPDVYDRTQFKVIEISSALASLQAAQLTKTASSRGHAEHVEIVNRSIFSWDKYVAAPCYFLAMEVFDNFGHDVIRYNPFTEKPLQGTVVIDGAGEFYEFYTNNLDPVASRFMKIRDAACNRPFNHPLRSPRFIRNLKARLPFAPNLSKPEYIPTRLMQFFDILRAYFPSHKLLISDFHRLPSTINGVNAPVVQTRYRRRVIPVSTLLVSACYEVSLHIMITILCRVKVLISPFHQVQQGYFDIIFPTEFAVVEDIYRHITGNFTRVQTQQNFLRNWAKVEKTRTHSGENPLLSWYANASVMTSLNQNPSLQVGHSP